MNKTFPYGYDVNAYIDKALVQMKKNRRDRCPLDSFPSLPIQKTI